MADTNPLAEAEALSLDDFLGAAHIVVNYHTAAVLAVPDTPLVATLPERLVSILDNTRRNGGYETWSG